MPSNGSPRSIFSSMMNDNTVAGALGEPVVDKNQPQFEGRTGSGKTDENETSIKDSGEIESNAFSESRASSRGNLVKRMATRAGTKAPRLNTQGIGPPDIPDTSDGQPNFLMTIPPGLSPTTLLESPVLLHNSQLMPSPTTGKFFFPPFGSGCSLAPIVDKGQENSFHDSSSFTFQPTAESGPLLYHNSANKVRDTDMGLVPVHAGDSNPQESISNEYYAKSLGEKPSNNGTSETCQDENGDQYCGDPSGSPCDDEHGWRKFAQKQVKGSEHPMNYKCTHEKNCAVKRKVEPFQEGDIIQTVYDGTHNHSKSLPNRRDTSQHDPSVNRDLARSTAHKMNTIPQEHSNGCGSQSQAQVELGDGLGGSSAYSNDEDDDRAMGGEGEELDSKKRRHETSCIPDLSVINRAVVREPRVVQTTSDVDILDDGYRWRKYGQKVVKGNPNPRSYYKCTSPGCNVRKHVERASHDLKCVITTYEGKHNHDVPAARNSSHNSGGLNNQQPSPLAVSGGVHRLELSHILGNSACFRQPETGSYGLSGKPQMNAGPMYGLGGLNQPPHVGLPGLQKLPLLHPYSGSLPPPMNR